MTDVFTFDRFAAGTEMGRVETALDEAFLARWRGIYPEDEGEGTLPAGCTTVILMHAWRTIVAPRPPGCVHAGQSVAVRTLPEPGEAIATAVRCVVAEERKGRRFVELETVSTGAGGRDLFTGRTRLFWAA